MLIMTSNVGSKAILGSMSKGGDGSSSQYKRVQADVRRELSLNYRPEFLNRLDEIIVFRPLTKPEIGSIAELMLSSVEGRAKGKGVSVHVDDSFKRLLLSEVGARPARAPLMREQLHPD
jgi:ATP-dependent Clp protease ATP-binding subunit ClpC